jgi:hypothetical protein
MLTRLGRSQLIGVKIRPHGRPMLIQLAAVLSRMAGPNGFDHSTFEEHAMNKSKQQFPFAMPEGMPAFPGFGKESFEWMSNAFS